MGSGFGADIQEGLQGGSGADLSWVWLFVDGRVLLGNIPSIRWARSQFVRDPPASVGPRAAHWL